MRYGALEHARQYLVGADLNLARLHCMSYQPLRLGDAAVDLIRPLNRRVEACFWSTNLLLLHVLKLRRPTNSF